MLVIFLKKVGFFVWKDVMGRADFKMMDVGIQASRTNRPIPGPARQAPDARGGARDDLAGKRVLVVEDEMLLALDLEEALRHSGCQVVGPAGNLHHALRLAESEQVDAAILDVNLAGEAVFPVAKLLAARQVPFLFATAYSATEEIYPRDVRSAPRLSKPYTIAQALDTLTRLLAR